MDKTIFGIQLEEIKRQCSIESLKANKTMPLTKFNSLKPCIDGGKQILKDKELSTMLRNLYRNI